MIDWNKIPIEEAFTIRAIVRRFAKLIPDADSMSTHMDIEATHISGCPLKLEELLKSEDSDFIHDIGGIASHINRETGKLENCFLPRYAKKQS